MANFGAALEEYGYADEEEEEVPVQQPSKKEVYNNNFVFHSKVNFYLISFIINCDSCPTSCVHFTVQEQEEEEEKEES